MGIGKLLRHVHGQENPSCLFKLHSTNPLLCERLGTGLVFRRRCYLLSARPAVGRSCREHRALLLPRHQHILKQPIHIIFLFSKPSDPFRDRVAVGISKSGPSANPRVSNKSEMSTAAACTPCCAGRAWQRCSTQCNFKAFDWTPTSLRQECVQSSSHGMNIKVRCNLLLLE